jgi:hypothetical protein
MKIVSGKFGFQKHMQQVANLDRELNGVLQLQKAITIINSIRGTIENFIFL